MEKHRREAERNRLREMASVEGQLVIFRRVWDHLPPERRELFKQGLEWLGAAQDAILDAAHELVCVGNVSTDCAACCETLAVYAAENADAPTITKTISKLRKDIYISPDEYLCAIACWENGEDYIAVETQPGLLGASLEDHPRWPARAKARHEEFKQRLKKSLETYDKASGDDES